MNLIERFRSALAPKPDAKSKDILQVGDVAIVLHGTWAGTMFRVTHLSADGRWVYSNSNRASKVSVDNCELVRG